VPAVEAAFRSVLLRSSATRIMIQYLTMFVNIFLFFMQ
jgi:hypothetical protein